MSYHRTMLRGPAFLLLAGVLWASQAIANGFDYADGADFVYADFLAWYEANKDASPQFVDGDVITAAQRELTDPFVPPGLQMADFYGEPITIKDAGDL